MGYDVQYAEHVMKILRKMDPYHSKIIVSWIDKNLIGCDNPRRYGAPLTANMKGLWRYRIGSYRVIADIHDDIITIEIVDAGHRREIYD